METVLIVLLMGVMNLLAFLIGARTAQKAHRGEEIELPNINPIQAYKSHTEQKEKEKEEEAYNTMLENIDNYCGDGLGQKDIV